MAGVFRRIQGTRCSVRLEKAAALLQAERFDDAITAYGGAIALVSDATDFVSLYCWGSSHVSGPRLAPCGTDRRGDHRLRRIGQSSTTHPTNLGSVAPPIRFLVPQR